MLLAQTVGQPSLKGWQPVQDYFFRERAPSDSLSCQLKRGEGDKVALSVFLHFDSIGSEAKAEQNNYGENFTQNIIYLCCCYGYYSL